MYDKFEHHKTRDLEFTDIYNLVEPIKKLEKGKWLSDLYWIENTLKEYSGLPADYEIKAFIEHAPQLSDINEGGFRIHHSLPSIVSSRFRVSVIENVPGNNGAYAVGPYIAYAKPALPPSKLRAEKKRLGRNLLVFPAHSIRGLNASFNIDAFCEKINEVAMNYDSVRICLYWKDILLGTAEKYKNYGFEVVTAGHYYDPMFMPRLKSIIETSTMTMSNELGTHIGYCLHLNKPHLIKESEVDYQIVYDEGKEFAKRQFEASKKIRNKFKHNAEIDLIKKLSSIDKEFITEDQYSLLNKYWGFDQVKTPKQLKKILLEIEGLYQLKNSKSQHNEIKRLKKQLNAKKRRLAQVLPIKGYIKYKNKNLVNRFKKKLGSKKQIKK